MRVMEEFRSASGLRGAAIFFTLLCLSVADVGNGQTIAAAVCHVLTGSGSGQISGSIRLCQKDGRVSLCVNLIGFDVNGPSHHGMHIHSVPSLGNKCIDAGPHLNLRNTTHGAPYDPPDKRHTGDLGNIEIDGYGRAIVTLFDWIICLTNGPNSVMGKPIVIHAMPDDLGRGNATTSNTTGNAGARLGCCIIEPAPLESCDKASDDYYQDLG